MSGRRSVRVLVAAFAVLAAALGLLLIGAGGLTSAGLIFAVALLVAAAIATGAVFATSGARPCPRCAKPVRNGVVVCPSCGFDFASVAP